MFPFRRSLIGVLAGFLFFHSSLFHLEAQEWKTQVQDFLKGKPYLGVVVVVVSKGKREIVGLGKVSSKGGESVPDENTLFEIGSITKAFTGTLLARLTLLGKVRPDDPVNKYLPENLRLPSRDHRDVSLLHLATHTGGIPVQPVSLPFYALTSSNPSDPYAEFGPDRLSKTLKALKPDHPFGSRFRYSNLGVGVLGHALAGANGSQSFEEALAQQVLQPLGMPDTVLKPASAKIGNLAVGHSKAGKVASGWTFATLEACGGLRSNGKDMAIFLESAGSMRETILKNAFEMAQRPWRETGSTDKFVGFCWMRQKSPGGDATLIWHNGGTGGYRSFLGFIPESNIGVVVLSNSAHSVDALALSILRELERTAMEPVKLK